jgi:hypothetical protein
MSDMTFRQIDSPQFVICDGIRAEVGGKRVLVGAYPGNIMTVPSEFPRQVVTETFSAVYSNRSGEVAGHLRVIRSDDNSEVFTDELSMTVGNLKLVVPCAFHVVCELTKPGRLAVQIRGSGDVAWLTLGTFEVITR